MLSKIISETGKTFYFDPEKFRLFDSNKKKINFDKTKYAYFYEFGYKPDIKLNPHKQFLRRCKIQLGLACNYKCQYCVQENFRIIEKQKAEIDRVVNTIYEKYDVENFQLWGGEPLVYWKTLKILIPKIREHFKDSSIVIISNGSLLDREKVNFFLKYDVTFMMSHDGPAFKKYRNNIDPLDDPEFIDLWNYFSEEREKQNKQYPSFHAVITPENCNIYELYQFFIDRVKHPVLSIEGICTLSKENETKITPFTQEDASVLAETYYQLFNGLKDTNLKYSAFQRFVAPIVRNFIDGYTMPKNKVRCANSSDDILIIDLEGNILACQGARIKTEKKVFFVRKDNQEKQNLFVFDRSICKKCTVVGICGRGCPIVSNDQIETYCRNMKIWSIVLFSIAFRVLMNEKIVAIDTQANIENTEG